MEVELTDRTHIDEHPEDSKKQSNESERWRWDVHKTPNTTSGTRRGEAGDCHKIPHTHPILTTSFWDFHRAGRCNRVAGFHFGNSIDTPVFFHAEAPPQGDLSNFMHVLRLATNLGHEEGSKELLTKSRDGHIDMEYCVQAFRKLVQSARWSETRKPKRAIDGACTAHSVTCSRI